MLTALPNGVLEMNQQMADMVETSTNLGTIRLNEEGFLLVSAPRSASPEKKEAVKKEFRRIADLFGAKSLLDVCKCKRAAAFGKENARACRDSVAVSIALDDGNDVAVLALFRDLGGDCSVVMPDCLGVNFNPGAGSGAQGQIGIGYIKFMIH